MFNVDSLYKTTNFPKGITKLKVEEVKKYFPNICMYIKMLII